MTSCTGVKQTTQTPCSSASTLRMRTSECNYHTFKRPYKRCTSGKSLVSLRSNRATNKQQHCRSTAYSQHHLVWQGAYRRVDTHPQSYLSCGWYHCVKWLGKCVTLRHQTAAKSHPTKRLVLCKRFSTHSKLNHESNATVRSYHNLLWELWSEATPRKMRCHPRDPALSLIVTEWNTRPPSTSNSINPWSSHWMWHNTQTSSTQRHK